MAIVPGVILIPGKMIILKEPLPCYNNVLTLATKDMKFGKNDNVNFFETPGNIEENNKDKEEEESGEEETKTPQSPKSPLLVKKKVTFTIMRGSYPWCLEEY